MRPPGGLKVIGPRNMPELIRSRFSERNGTIGTLFYIRYRPSLSRNDGHNLIRMSDEIDRHHSP